MRLTLAIILSASITLAFADLAEDVSKLPPIKIDKNLRRALLKALEDLEAESAEQKHEHPTAEELVMKITTDAQPFKGTTFSFNDFPPRDDVPSEDKLQNSTFVETEKIQVAEPHQEEKLIFQQHDILLGDKLILEKSPESSQVDQILPRSVKTTGSKSNSIDQPLNKKEEKESLSLSPSNGIVSASANSLVPPSPTPPSPTVKPAVKNITSALLPTVPTVVSVKTSEKSGDSEVKIFQAPLVAAFTVQQDERGIAKSVVPLYKPGSDNQGLTLQEQLDFKQQLLERQLNELQAQHAQQTEFLLKQQQLYQEQLRNKQRQQLYLQEQSRLKQIEEQRQLQLQQQQQQLQQQQQQQKQQQQLHQQQQQQLQQQQPQALQGAFTQNNFLAFQPPFQTQNVQFQSSQSFQLPNTALPPPFQQTPSVQDQLRLQQLQRQQFIQQQAQQLQLQRQQAVYLQQQRLQQSFPGFQNEFQPPVSSSANRFHRQEAFGTVGNLGLNENRQNTRNHLTLEPPRIPAQNFGGFNQFAYRQQAQLQGRTQTPARQIQHLLFQSGVAGGLNNPQGNTNQEDLNIVSKVLALNVGAVPNKTARYNQESFSRA